MAGEEGVMGNIDEAQELAEMLAAAFDEDEDIVAIFDEEA